MLFLIPFWPRIPATTHAVRGTYDIHFALSDRYLAHLVATRASNLGIVTLSNITIVSAPPSVLVAGATASIASIGAPVTIETAPVVHNGTLRVDVVATHLGAFPLPSGVSDLVASNINASIRHLISPDARLQVVRVTRSGLEIYANYR